MASNNSHILLMVSFLIFFISISQAQNTLPLDSNTNGNFRLRVFLYDTIDQPYPNLIFDDSQGFLYNFVNLNNYDFADKIAWISIEKGRQYRQGDEITLYDAVYDNYGAEDAISLPPGDYDLNDFNWADRMAGFAFPS